MNQPDISFIVSAFDRPIALLGCIASLKLQTHKNIEIIITDNGDSNIVCEFNRDYVEIDDIFDVKYVETLGPTCYHSAEVGAQYARGRYLCFPSDDSYYCPPFAEEMLKAADLNNWDLVYCEMLHSFRGSKYAVLGTEARLNRIDKTGFLVKRELFPGFPDKTGGDCAADGLLIERLVRSGIRHGKVDSCLVVHT